MRRAGITVLLLSAAATAAPAKPPALTRPAIEELALRIVEQAEAAKPEAPVGIFVEGSPSVLARAFASAVSSQLATKKRGPTVLDASSAAEAESLCRSHDVRTLLRLVVQLDGTKLVARGDAIHTWVSFWAGASVRRDGPAVVLAATVEADTQALSLAAPMQVPVAPAGPLKVAMTSLARLSAVPAALAFGDVDGDGKPELAVLQEDAVVVLDADGKPRWRHELREVQAAPSPSREPFGAIAVLPSPARIVVASTRKARVFALFFRGGRLELGTADAPVMADGVGVKPVAGMNVFDRNAVIAGRTVELPAPFTTASSRGANTLVVSPDGVATLVDSPARVAGVGAAAALADLDGDGTPEAFVSSARYAVDGDEVKVLSLAQLGAAPLWSGSTPRGRAIVALGADLDGDKAEEIIVGVWLPDGTGELLVARAIK